MSFYYPTRSRDQILRTALGYTAETIPRPAANAPQIMVDGTAYFMAVGLRAGDVVTNISICINTQGATMTLSKVGLYAPDGTRLAISADQGAGWETTGIKTVAVTTPYTVTADGGFFVAMVAKGGTLPTPVRSNTNGFIGLAVGSGMRAFGTQAAQTDLPASATITNGIPIYYWAAVS